MDRAYLRIITWIGLSVLLSILIAPNFLSLLSQALDGAFDSVVPAIPFSALLFVLFLFRGNDLLKIVREEKGLSSELYTRLVGVSGTVSFFFLRGIVANSVVLSGVTIILVFFFSSLALNPLTRRIMLPYAVIYVMGACAPTILQWVFGQPLALLSTDLSTLLVKSVGIPAVWQGTQFSLDSVTGDTLTATITPGCSSLISISTFLCLLGLLHFDMKKNLVSTFKLAVSGIAVLTALNSVRILILVWVGYTRGAVEFWSVHNWVGYSIFLGFYLVAIIVYSKMGTRTGTTYANGKRFRLF